MSNPLPLQGGDYYHIFNRGVNRQNLFLEERNYRYFLKLYAHHVEPVAETYAYCLLPNHFHLLVRIKTAEEQQHDHEIRKVPEIARVSNPGQAFSNLFNAYTKAMNQAYGRTGSLFERPFHRLAVTSDSYFAQLVVYIHQNPQRHGLSEDFRQWPYSSYQALCSSGPTRIKRDDVLAWFGGPAQLVTAHHQHNDAQRLKPVLLEDW